jgi:hypothetical protein
MGSFIPNGVRKRGRAATWSWRGSLLPPKTLGKLIAAIIILATTTTVPSLLGIWNARTDSDFPVIDRGKDYTEAVLGVYGDRAFLGEVHDDVVVGVQMVAVSDLEGKPISTQEIGPLRYDPLYLSL